MFYIQNLSSTEVLVKDFIREGYGDWAIIGIISRLEVNIIKNNMGMFKKNRIDPKKKCMAA